MVGGTEGVPWGYRKERHHPMKKRGGGEEMGKGGQLYSKNTFKHLNAERGGLV